jgi:hypothetical protein
MQHEGMQPSTARPRLEQDPKDIFAQADCSGLFKPLPELESKASQSQACQWTFKLCRPSP